MKSLSLSHRLSAVFIALLLACTTASVWWQLRASERHEQEVVQRLSLGLASHVASHSALMQPGGLDPQAVRDLFSKLMDVNPSVEVYLLDPQGRIQAHAAPPGHLKRDRVALEPLRRLRAGAPLPVLGDDPRSDTASKVFSAAPLKLDGQDAGWIYVVLLGEDRDALAARVAQDTALRTTLWFTALTAASALLAGLAAFRWITRPLSELTKSVQALRADGLVASERRPASLGAHSDERDEISVLRAAVSDMSQRISEQWRELTTRDQQRRELVANISHDLRTPLTSLHGYLETLRVKSDRLSARERDRYLDIAIGQSRKVGQLAQELFELARLEHGGVRLDPERFAIGELLQDVLEKFELAAQARRQALGLEAAHALPQVVGDVGLLERVFTNLLDNAIRHTPAGGRVEVQLLDEQDAVRVRVCDTGPGVPPQLRPTLFQRPSLERHTGCGGGLGLVIVRRILQLHGSDVRLVDTAGWGAVFEFRLAVRGVPSALRPVPT